MRRSGPAVGPRSGRPSDPRPRDAGLKTDIYAFGIVAWEVMTRQTAWYWMTNTLGVMGQMTGGVKAGGVDGPKRPRLPDGLTPEVERLIRMCLHQVRGRRTRGPRAGWRWWIRCSFLYYCKTLLSKYLPY